VRFVKFLEDSKLYRPDRILALLPHEGKLSNDMKTSPES
jgi:hypothetical protein